MMTTGDQEGRGVAAEVGDATWGDGPADASRDMDAAV